MRETIATKKPSKIVIKKHISFSNKFNSIVSIFFIAVICLNVVGLLYTIDSIAVIRNKAGRLTQRVEIIENSSSRIFEENTDNKINTYYRELSDKTDETIDRIMIIVGILATIVTFFGVLLAFKAPRDIEKRMDELNTLITKSEESSKEAKYQAEIIEAINVDYNGKLTNLTRIRQISDVIAKYPEKPDAYMHRGFLYDQMIQKVPSKRIKFIHLAISDYEIARKLDVDMSSYYNSMGVAYSRLEDYHKAISYYTKAIKEDSNNAAAYVNRGGDYDNIGEHQKSLDDFEKAFEIESDYYDAYLGRNYTYQSLWRKESDPEQRDDYIRLQMADLEKAIEINPDDDTPEKLLKGLIGELSSRNITDGFGFYETQEEARNIMIAKIDEKIGDLYLEDNEHVEAFKQYMDAVRPYSERFLLHRDTETKDKLVRIISKLHSIDSDVIEIRKKRLEPEISAFCKAMRALPVILYISGDKETAEKLLIILLNYDNNKNASLNLAFMRRRGETEFTNQSTTELLDLYEDKQSAIWCVNKALCYVYGVDVETNWYSAIEFLDKSETNIDDSLEWWSQIEIVGSKESNVVFLLFAISKKYNVTDPILIEERIYIAEQDGFTIPDDLHA